MQGVLTVTGDEGPNDIEFVQRNDGVVDLLGDGEKHTFEGVNKIVARTGGGDDRVSGKIVLWVRDVEPNAAPFVLDLDLGAGNDTARIEDDNLITFRDLNDPLIRNLVTTHSIDAQVDLGTGTDDLAFQAEHHDVVNVDVNSTDSFDSVNVNVQNPVPDRLRFIASKASVTLNLAGGGHSVDVQTQGVNVVDLNVVVYADRAPSDPSGNTVYISASGGGVWKAAVELGGDRNLLDVNTKDVDQVVFNATISGDGNTVQFVGRHTGDLVGIDFRPSCLIDLNFVGSNNQGTVSNQGYGIWEVNLAQPLASGDSTSTGTPQTSSFLVSFDRPIDPAQGATPTGTVTFFVDGNPQVPGSDSFEVHGQDFGAATVEADTAGGNDSIWIDIGAPVMTARLALGEGDDNARLDHQPQTWFSEGPAPINLVVSITTGEGDDTVHATVLPSVTDLIIDPFNPARIAIDSGDGDDKVFVQTTDVEDLHFNFAAGAGDDTVEVDAQSTNPISFTRDGRSSGMVVDLGQGNDVATFSMAGILNGMLDIMAGPGNDEVQVGAVSGRITGIAVDPSDSGTVYNQRVDLGPGDDVADIRTEDFSVGSHVLTAGDGNDSVHGTSISGPGVYKTTDGGLTWNVNLGSGNDSLQLDNQVVGKLANLIDAGEGNDSVTTRSNVFAVFLTVGFFEVRDDVQAGAGDDVVTIHNEGFTDVNTSADMGEGNDTIEMFASRPGVGILKSTDGGASNLGTVTFTMTLGFGDDGAKINLMDYGNVNGRVNADEGDDTIVSSSSPPRVGGAVAAVLYATLHNNDINLGGGNDRLEADTSGVGRSYLQVDAGDGNDSVKFKPLFTFPVEDLDRRPELRVSALLGAGDDSLEIIAAGRADTNILADAGAGNDVIHSKTGSSTSAGQSQGLFRYYGDVSGDYNLGTGDDLLVVETHNVSQAHIKIDAGDGNDEVLMRHRMFALIDRTNLNLVILLGAGNDKLVIDEAGLRRVRTSINTGPLGNGIDSVSVVCQSLRRGGRKFSRSMTLDGRADVVRVKAQGYIVQQVSQTPISVEWVFVA